MRDPHVERLTYRLTTDDSVSFDSPPPIEQETDEFTMRLEDGVVAFEMKTHHATEATTRREVEQWLGAWEIGFALDTGRPALGFEFAGAEIVDRDPPPPNEVSELSVSVCDHAYFRDEVYVRRVCPAYPTPPTRFRISRDVETMWLRFRQYQEGKEPLASMAYACATLFEDCNRWTGGGYNVSKKILKRLTHLGTNVGDRRTVRKWGQDRIEMRPHTPAEVAWVEAAVKALIRRMGEYEADPTGPLEQLTMADLPQL